MTTPSSTAAAATGTIREPLPTRPDDLTVLAATGEVIWASFSGDGPETGNRLSRDAGRTWTPGVGSVEIVGATGYRGRFGYVGGDDGEGVPYLMDPTAPSQARALHWDDEGGGMFAVGAGAVLNDHRLLMTPQRTRRVTFPRLPGTVRRPAHRYAFSGDVKHVVRISTTTGSRDYAGVLATASGRSLGLLRLPRTPHHRVAGSVIFSLVADASGLRLCRQPLPSGRPACQQIATGARKAARTKLYQFGGISVVRDSMSSSPLLVEGARVLPVRLPAGTTGWRAEGPGDPTRPLLRTVDSRGEPHHVRVEADGSTSEWVTLRRLPVTTASLALTPTTLLGSWVGAGPGQVWARAVGDGRIGDPTLIPGGTVVASAARWLIGDASEDVRLYDGSVPAGRIPGGAHAISGPYLNRDGAVHRVDGRRLTDGRAEAIFGSLVAERVPPSKAEDAFVVSIRDLADPTARAVRLTLAAPGRERFSRVMMWGDWIGSTWFAADGLITELHNVRTGQVLSREGGLWQLCDGYAVLEVRGEPPAADSELAVWTLATDALTGLGKGSSPIAFAAEADRIAYTNGAELLVRTLPGVATGQPRMLGAIATGRATVAAPWMLALDASRPLSSGTLAIANRSGLIVRTLPTPATATGSLRGLSWDGRDEAGSTVRAGSYRWTLLASGPAGTGQVVDVRGTGAAGGTITVG